NHELLAAIDAHLQPRARPSSGLVEAGPPLGHYSLKSLRLYGVDKVSQRRVDLRRIADWLGELRHDLVFQQPSSTLERLVPKVPPGHHHHVKHVEQNRRGGRMVLECIERWPAIIAERHQFAV